MNQIIKMTKKFKITFYALAITASVLTGINSQCSNIGDMQNLV